jgi:hypothetical protein
MINSLQAAVFSNKVTNNENKYQVKMEEEQVVFEVPNGSAVADAKPNVTKKRKRVYDKEKKKAHDRKYRAKNREKILQKTRDKNKTEAGKARRRNYCQKRKNKRTEEACFEANRSRQRDVIRELREGQTCVLCPHDQAHHLEFDHLDPTKKIKPVTDIFNIEKLKAEAAKCQLLCIWCHRVKTWTERRLLLVIHTKPEPDAEGKRCNGFLCKGQIRANEHFYLRRGKPVACCKTCDSFRAQQIRKERAEYVNNKKRNVFKKCQNQNCEREVKEGFEMCFDFDHLDPKTKKNSISRMVCSGASHKALDAELAKCRLLCCYCHKDHTAEQMKYYYSDAKKMNMKDTTE